MSAISLNISPTWCDCTHIHPLLLPPCSLHILENPTLLPSSPSLYRSWFWSRSISSDRDTWNSWRSLAFMRTCPFPWWLSSLVLLRQLSRRMEFLMLWGAGDSATYFRHPAKFHSWSKEKVTLNIYSQHVNWELNYCRIQVLSKSTSFLHPSRAKEQCLTPEYCFSTTHKR